jgi:hypothetical protein
MKATKILALALAACGGGGASPDAGVDAPPAAAPRAVIVVGDGQRPGVLATFDPATRTVKPDAGPAGAIGKDPVLRHAAGELLVINRAEGNVTVLDDQTLAIKETLATGGGSIPEDAAAVGAKLYVPTSGTRGVTVVTRGQTGATVIDLSADDADGKPDCMTAYAVGTDVYVACQLLDGTAARGAGKVYVIDSRTDTVTRSVALLHELPASLLEQIPAGARHAGDLVISTAEDRLTAGCVERFAPGDAAATCWVENVQLNGFATRVAFLVDGAEGVGLFAVPTRPPAADLLAFDMPSDLLWAGALNPMSQVITDVAVCPGDETVVYDAAASGSGLRMYNGAAELTTAALAIGIASGVAPHHGLVCY